MEGKLYIRLAGVLVAPNPLAFPNENAIFPLIASLIFMST